MSSHSNYSSVSYLCCGCFSDITFLYLYLGGGSAEIRRPETDIFEESSPRQRRVTNGETHTHKLQSVLNDVNRLFHGYFTLHSISHILFSDCNQPETQLNKHKK